jgi:hypothetical protein
MNLSLSVILLAVASILVPYSADGICAPLSPDGQVNPDRQVIAQLAGVGSNLGKPHHIEFFFYFPTKAQADKIAARLKADSFSTLVRKALSTHEYAIQAWKTMLPVESDLVALRARFNSLSATENGVYDGWGAEVAK